MILFLRSMELRTKTALAVWCSMPHLATVFSRLARAPSQVSPGDLNAIERYVVLLYQRTSALSHVNEAGKQLFAHNHNIPPTLHALEQHLKRVVYEAGHIWGQSLIGDPEVPSPDSWGWKRATYDSSWTPCWTYLPEAAQELSKGLQKTMQMCKGSSRMHTVVLLLRTLQSRMRALDTLI